MRVCGRLFLVLCGLITCLERTLPFDLCQLVEERRKKDNSSTKLAHKCVMNIFLYVKCGLLTLSYILHFKKLHIVFSAPSSKKM